MIHCLIRRKLSSARGYAFSKRTFERRWKSHSPFGPSRTWVNLANNTDNWLKRDRLILSSCLKKERERQRERDRERERERERESEILLGIYGQFLWRNIVSNINAMQNSASKRHYKGNIKEISSIPEYSQHLKSLKNLNGNRVAAVSELTCLPFSSTDSNPFLYMCI